MALKPTPAMDVLLARPIEDPPSAPVLTDEDLDRRDGRANQPKRAAKHAAKAKPAAREPGLAAVEDDASSASSSSDGDADAGSGESSSSNSSSSSGSSSSC